jgi:biotin transport system substrate-specific component
MNTKKMILIGLFAAIISVSSYISIPLPFSTVPFTAQTLSIMIVGLILPLSMSMYSVGLFILLGIIGLPVFSGGSGGLSVIVGPTGGYIIGFIFGTLVIGLLKKKFETLYGFMFSSIMGGIIVVYFFGVLYLNYSTGMGIIGAVLNGALPFIPMDIIKAFLASIIAHKTLPTIKRMI